MTRGVQEKTLFLHIDLLYEYHMTHVALQGRFTTGSEAWVIDVKKSSLRVLGSNSKFNANKLNGKAANNVVYKLPKTLAKKKV